ncbi:MAG TPA: flagellar hook protein FlgE [Rhizomicrobium sp.]|nr:flagellar hook protein FlgE [Rhizomicrobium sp.]
MSLYGALLTGVAGLSAQSEALSVSSANIANVDTVGYKSSQTRFATVLASTVSGGASEASVSATPVQNVAQAGLLQAASSPTDLAISGNGFFVTTQSATNTANLFYTQAGDFAPDGNGNLVNSSGYYLLGYPVTTAAGVTTVSSTLAPVNVAALSGTAQATTSITLQANLQSTSAVDAAYAAGDMTAGNVQPDFTRTINVYDSQGGSQPLSFNFVETGANTWAYEVDYTGNANNLTSGAASNPVAQGTLTFNSDGTLANVNGASPATGNLTFSIPWSASSGLSAQSVTVNMGTVGSSNGMTQFDSPSTLTNATPNGASVGNLTGVSVTSDGSVTAQYSNGLNTVIYQIPIATFANPDGLTPISGTAYQKTLNSGTAILNTAGAGGAGTIKSSELEQSTVDINTEFTNLITSQNAYSAAARILTTVNQMLQTLDQIPA